MCNFKKVITVATGVGLDKVTGHKPKKLHVPGEEYVRSHNLLSFEEFGVAVPAAEEASDSLFFFLKKKACLFLCCTCCSELLK